MEPYVSATPTTRHQRTLGIKTRPILMEVHATIHFVFRIFQTIVTFTTGSTATIMMAARELEGM